MKNNVYQIDSAKKSNSKNYVDKRKRMIRIFAFLGAALIFGTFCVSLFLM